MYRLELTPEEVGTLHRLLAGRLAALGPTEQAPASGSEGRALNPWEEVALLTQLIARLSQGDLRRAPMTAELTGEELAAVQRSVEPLGQTWRRPGGPPPGSGAFKSLHRKVDRLLRPPRWPLAALHRWWTAVKGLFFRP